ncbi:Hypothetical predicted protein [Xyrichtys novacula]|uniref:Uncharacterized protein n=1 Tax=Xyrichtys novacula TaxID=13765 RepID=A0AAV1FQI3_XYRNO|nr:Hypothetical predicted protein [Xyrichtys novacula]
MSKLPESLLTRILQTDAAGIRTSNLSHNTVFAGLEHQKCPSVLVFRFAASVCTLSYEFRTLRLNDDVGEKFKRMENLTETVKSLKTTFKDCNRHGTRTVVLLEPFPVKVTLTGNVVIMLY